MPELTASRPTTWRVRAEAVGMLTLPPDRPCLKIRNVEVALQDRAQAADKPREVTTSWRGPLSITGLAGLKEAEPAVGLSLTVTVEAQTSKEARAKAEADLEGTICLMGLASHAAISPAYVVGVFPESPAVGAMPKLHLRAASGQVLPWTSECDRLLSTVEQAYGKLPGDDRRRFLNSLHWWRRGHMEEEAHTKFLFFWFAIEALTGMSFVVNSLPKNSQRRPTVASKIAYLLSTRIKVWSATECKERYDLRSRLAHGDIIVTAQEEDAMNEHIHHLQNAINAVVHWIITGES
jgi:hypothetical protein